MPAIADEFPSRPAHETGIVNVLEFIVSQALTEFSRQVRE
jgi:hypothetical protein